MQKFTRFLTIYIVILSLFSIDAFSRDMNKNPSLQKPTGDPLQQLDKVHKTGTLWNTNSNFSFGDECRIIIITLWHKPISVHHHIELSISPCTENKHQ
jgi:hypothetical protein